MMISRSTSSILKLTSPEVKEQMYGSFRTKLYEANQEANDCLDYLNRIRRMIRSSDIFTVTLVIVLLLPLSMIFVGSSFQEECPKEPRILVYLLVTGSTGTLKMILSLWRQVSFRRSQKYESYNTHHNDYDDDDDDESLVVTKMLKFTSNFLTLFLIVWFVLGNVWVFGIWWPNPYGSLHKPIDWCNRSVFIYCIVHIMIVYILLAVAVLTVIILIICYMCQRTD
ncbi:transmembrane protein 272 [Octopus bimaculoides]|uniref:Uncharacterized protein n=1 Tax=Octopus bimaculoides TaxID=37653 RepID=A0A0L8IFG0_OCTBM|nr:transmembrane protein 272 [Octopus bimaculoides]XP_014770018.1 transmembrane protein 272 [Octopus bimaculoides]XP_014770025.1 transmembrane protein 272 [Octopus bimaculoides]XP_014770035.1 transmembrane protein 272 [Octopus bimaculoides]|eukprot:XP_014770009.1 PREDICTED: uncharacterized protein LOC106869026 [Octopus bimaculoides]